MSVGQLQLLEFEVNIMTVNQAGSIVDGLIGVNILKQYKVTVDYINGVIYLERPILQLKRASFWDFT